MDSTAGQVKRQLSDKSELSDKSVSVVSQCVNQHTDYVHMEDQAGQVKRALSVASVGSNVSLPSCDLALNPTFGTSTYG